MAGIEGTGELLAIKVAAGFSVRAAAAEAGVSESTGYRASAKPEFKRRVSELRTESAQAAVGKLSDAASRAVETLVELLDKSEEPTTRLQASKAILSQNLRMAEQLELRQRLDDIEKQGQLRAVS